MAMTMGYRSFGAGGLITVAQNYSGNSTGAAIRSCNLCISSKCMLLDRVLWSPPKFTQLRHNIVQMVQGSVWSAIRRENLGWARMSDCCEQHWMPPKSAASP